VVRQDGSLYVLTSAGSYQLRIAVFAPGAEGDVAPVRVIEGPGTGLNGATSLALDRQGRIYVANNLKNEDPVLGSATITVYASDAAGDAAPIRTIGGWSTRLSNPSGIAVADDGTIYVANLGVYSDDQGSVQTFAVGASEGDKAARTLVGREAALAGPQSIAVGRGDTLYVLNRQVPRIAIYPPAADGPSPPVRTIEGDSTGLRSLGGSDLPGRMAIDAAGYLYVADPAQASGLNAYGPDLGAVRVFRPEADGNEVPVRTIIGGFTKLNGPGGVAVDRAGNLYVPNRYGTGPGSVTVYGPGADGDVRPLRMIAGMATGLQAPAAVALDAHDTLYVVNAASVTIYAPGAAGDAAPVRTIAAE
jgi:sugar lactone lactonase YvrE